jgi:hypothetical protein
MKLDNKIIERTDIDKHTAEMSKILKDAQDKERRELHGGQTVQETVVE